MPWRSEKASAWGLALRTYRANFGQCVGFILVQFTLRLAVLLPLLFLLVTGPGDRWMRWLAWLWAPAFVFLVLPARQSAAFAMKRLITGEGRLFAPDLLTCGEPYPLRLWRGVESLLLMLPWCCPLIAGIIYTVNAMNGTTAGKSDGLTLLLAITSLGIPRLALIVLSLILLVLAGLAFNSGRRHEYAWDDMRIVLMRNRVRTMLIWFAGLALFIPFAGALGFVFYHYIRGDAMGFLTNLLTMLVRGQLPLPGKHALAALGVVFVLLPLIPLKSLLTAARVALLHMPDDGQFQ